jgi:5-methyltetrahydrofolate--homocysteine methyltransferase
MTSGLSLGDRLRNGPLLLLDGGLGTELIRRGLPAGAPPESWVLERPEVLAAIHREYVMAGSEAVHACTFGANPTRLARYGLLARMEEINLRAVGLARASRARYVIADVGPTGEALPPVGHGDPEQWREGFIRQGEMLARSGADALHVETMMDLREARIALGALLQAAPEIPILVSLTFERRRRGFFTVMGDALVASLAALVEAGASAAGANCTLTASDMADLAREAVREISAPFVFQPNAGQPHVTAAGLSYAENPEEFAASLAPLCIPEASARGRIAALGGCCGTDPRSISALRLRLAAL